MIHGFCGKDCEGCDRFADHRCLGCSEGPGASLNTACSIASCVRRKGIADCAACTIKNNCGQYADRQVMPRIREENEQAGAKHKQLALEGMATISTGLWILLLSVIPRIMGSICTSFLDLPLVGDYLSIGSLAITSIALLRMGTAYDSYRTAGILSLLRFLSYILTVFILPSNGLLFIIPALADGILFVFAMGYLYSGNATALLHVDRELSQKWTTLWSWAKWVVGLYVVVPILTLLFIGSPLAAIPALAMLVLAFAVVGVFVAELFYLYKSAKAASRCKEALAKQLP